MSPSTERFHALDAVRGFALLLGVVFHATASFIPGEQAWMVMDRDRSHALSVLFFTSHMFRMTLFFVMAGFFGRLLLERRGERGFAVDRAHRIALPLVVFWPPLFALIVAAVIFGAYVTTGGDPAAAPDYPTPETPLPFPLTHLWFLYLLLWMYLGALALRRVTRALAGPLDRLTGWIVPAAAGPVVMALPVFAMFVLAAAEPTAGVRLVQWAGVPTPDYSLLPNATAVVAYGTAFGFGWLLHRQPSLMRAWQRRWPLHLLAAVAATAGALALLGLTPSARPAPEGAEAVAAAALYALGTWCWTFGLIGAALRWLPGESAWRRYVADASYWIYLAHLPLVIALQGALALVPLPWWVKFPLLLAVALALLFASYHWLVRRTWLGAMLNGRRVRPGASKTEEARGEHGPVTA